jgi:hypothetical protein
MQETLTILFWYFAGVVGSIVIYAYFGAKYNPETPSAFSLKVFFEENILRIMLALFSAAFFALLIFSTEGVGFVEKFLGIQVSTGEPLIFGGIVGLLIVKNFSTLKSGRPLKAPGDGGGAQTKGENQ